MSRAWFKHSTMPYLNTSEEGEHSSLLVDREEGGLLVDREEGEHLAS